ncbi:hypothetical protein [Planobispora rosea]|nr:hypothetical protein [Planobispora rosea]
MRTHELMCPVCGALANVTCVQDGQELPEIHPSRTMPIYERNWRAQRGWVPPELLTREGAGTRSRAGAGRRASTLPAALPRVLSCEPGPDAPHGDITVYRDNPYQDRPRRRDRR